MDAHQTDTDPTVVSTDVPATTQQAVVGEAPDVAPSDSSETCVPTQQAVRVAVLTRGQIFDGLSKDLPMNELGLPKFLYRSDLITEDFQDLPPPERSALLNTATIPITYREGYPTFFDGTPIWNQMDTEDDNDHGMFQLYLGLGTANGFRQLSALPGEIAAHYPTLKASNRAEERALLLRLQELAALNFWFLRAKACDLFKTAMHRKVRENRLLNMEDYHFLQADRVLAKLVGSLEDVFSPDRIAAMEPLDFIKAMKEAAGIQQRALGITERGAGGKKDESAPPAGASMEVTLRSVAKSSGATDTSDRNGSNKDVLEILRNGDSETISAAQELILKVSMGGRKQSDQSIVSDRGLASDEREDLAMIHGDSDD